MKARGTSSGSWGVAWVDRGVLDAGTLWVSVPRAQVPDEATRIEAAVLRGAHGEPSFAPVVRGVAGGDLIVYRFDLGILGSDVDSLAVEWATREGLRALSDSARARADSAGIPVLPFPEVGRPYAFDLDYGDGGRLRSADYAGKVLLVECWATWCAPCAALRPDLDRLAEAYGPRGLAIAGVNFDFDEAVAREAIAKGGSAANSVLAGADESTTSAWSDVTTVAGIPHFFLIDREGVLRLESPHAEVAALERAIREALGEPTSRS